jgi:uncharacterized protein YabE (DUF348 family)
VRKSIIAAVGATAVLAIVGGSAAYAAKSKTVTVSVDGQPQKVHTFGSTVADALEAKDITVGEHDLVAPGLQSKLQEGQEIAVRFGRQLTVTVDGRKRSFWTTATNLNDALVDLGLRFDGALLSTSRSAAIGREGLALTVRTPKTVILLRAGKPVPFRTTGMTVREALAQAKVKVDRDDRVSPALSSVVRHGLRITVVRMDPRRIATTVAVPFAKQETKTDALFEGDTKTTREGVAGRQVVTYLVWYADGKVLSRRVLTTRVLTRPVTELVQVGTREKPASQPADPPIGDTGVWDRIAECESGGNWQANTGNGYYGGLQFSLSTWRAYGGSGYPHQNSRAQQIAIGQKLQAAAGWGQWPACSRQLGLR